MQIYKYNCFVCMCIFYIHVLWNSTYLFLSFLLLHLPSFFTVVLFLRKQLPFIMDHYQSFEFNFFPYFLIVYISKLCSHSKKLVFLSIESGKLLYFMESCFFTIKNTDVCNETYIIWICKWTAHDDWEKNLCIFMAQWNTIFMACDWRLAVFSI